MTRVTPDPIIRKVKRLPVGIWRRTDYLVFYRDLMLNGRLKAPGSCWSPLSGGGEYCGGPTTDITVCLSLGAAALYNH